MPRRSPPIPPTPHSPYTVNDAHTKLLLDLPEEVHVALMLLSLHIPHFVRGDKQAFVVQSSRCALRHGIHCLFILPLR